MISDNEAIVQLITLTKLMSQKIDILTYRIEKLEACEAARLTE
jgi:hypothetical protein